MVKQKDFPKSHKVVLLHLLFVKLFTKMTIVSHTALHLKYHKEKINNIFLALLPSSIRKAIYVPLETLGRTGKTESLVRFCLQITFSFLMVGLSLKENCCNTVLLLSPIEREARRFIIVEEITYLYDDAV